MLLAVALQRKQSSGRGRVPMQKVKLEQTSHASCVRTSKLINLEKEKEKEIQEEHVVPMEWELVATTTMPETSGSLQQKIIPASAGFLDRGGKSSIKVG